MWGKHAGTRKLFDVSVSLGDSGIVCAVGAEFATGVHQNEAQTFSGVSCLVLTTRHPGKSLCLHFWWPVLQIWPPGTDSAQTFWDLAAYLQHFGVSCNAPCCIVAPCAHFMDGFALFSVYVSYILHILVQVGAVRCRCVIVNCTCGSCVYAGVLVRETYQVG